MFLVGLSLVPVRAGWLSSLTSLMSVAYPFYQKDPVNSTDLLLKAYSFTCSILHLLLGEAVLGFCL